MTTNVLFTFNDGAWGNTHALTYGTKIYGLSSPS
nr:MAG TPA: hypothetical protein [Caudoviricetes sp.]DAO51158.1 MAG TPA: hypothetical protein [Caudoviricetes sp.]DAQ35827.1 MAG TPA: hypothetical protein [Caudoviricetes sp.]DAR95690.1 MAG TPA: hypothetical protein [Caudoviricetes sp.]